MVMGFELVDIFFCKLPVPFSHCIAYGYQCVCCSAKGTQHSNNRFITFRDEFHYLLHSFRLTHRSASELHDLHFKKFLVGKDSGEYFFYNSILNFSPRKLRSSTTECSKGIPL